MKIQIHFDGGCIPNPGNMYGSYAISIDGSEMCKTTEDYGAGTNNVAEFQALYHALSRTFRILETLDREPRTCVLELFTDSVIVKNRLDRPDKPRKSKYENSEGGKRMRHWTERCSPLLKRFNRFTVTWNSRTVNVEKFGH